MEHSGANDRHIEAGHTMVPPGRALPLHFVNDRWLKLLWRFYAVVGGAASFSLLGSPIAPVAQIGIGIAGAAYVYWCWVAMPRVGVEIRTDGVRIVGPFRRRFVPWATVQGFREVPRGLYPAVRLDLRTGQQLRAYVVQGRKVFWNGGATTDIVGVLNEEVRRVRASEAEKSVS